MLVVVVVVVVMVVVLVGGFFFHGFCGSGTLRNEMTTVALWAVGRDV